MPEPFEINIKTNKRVKTILFLLLWILVTTYFTARRQTLKNTDYIFILVILYAFYWLIWLIAGSNKVTVTSSFVEVRKKIFGITYWKNSYQIDEIKMLRKRSNEDADTGWGRGFFTVYDINPTTIHFDYFDRDKKIGEGLVTFNADEVIKEIKMRQGKTILHDQK